MGDLIIIILVLVIIFVILKWFMDIVTTILKGVGKVISKLLHL